MGSIRSEKSKVTILTPTYNRAHTLPRLYNSLLCQKDMHFEWVIIDDGSDDNTKEIIEGFKTKDFPIRYMYKENGGKHTAINMAVKAIETSYTFIVDSDDFLLENTMELVNHWIEEIDDDSSFAGVAGVRVHDDVEHSVIGQFPEKYEYVDCLNSERKKKKLIGDKAEVYRTNLLKANPFPEYKDEKFMPENVIWNKFALMGLKVRWHKEGIVVCEYLEGGLTSATRKKSHFKNNFKGYREECNLSLKVLPFPYDLSAGSVFYAKCCDWGWNKQCLNEFNISKLEKLIIIMLGEVRHKVGRY